MAKVHLLVGSVTGRAQTAAQTISDTLKEQGHDPHVFTNPTLSDVTADDASALIFVTSTTGQGDLPQTITPLYVAMQSEFPMLTQKQFAVVALGDSSYATFCQAGERFEELLFELQAQPICERFNIDALEHFNPVDVARTWALNCAGLIK